MLRCYDRFQKLPKATESLWQKQNLFSSHRWLFPSRPTLVCSMEKATSRNYAAIRCIGREPVIKKLDPVSNVNELRPIRIYQEAPWNRKWSTKRASGKLQKRFRNNMIIIHSTSINILICNVHTRYENLLVCWWLLTTHTQMKPPNKPRTEDTWEVK